MMHHPLQNVELAALLPAPLGPNPGLLGPAAQSISDTLYINVGATGLMFFAVQLSFMTQLCMLISTKFQLVTFFNTCFECTPWNAYNLPQNHSLVAVCQLIQLAKLLLLWREC